MLVAGVAEVFEHLAGMATAVLWRRMDDGRA